MKRVWINPELKDLSLKKTEESITCECCAAIFDPDLNIIMIPGDDEGEWKHNKPHHGQCPNNPNNKPAKPGFGPVGSVTPGLDATPIS